MTFSKKLRELRKKKRLNQDELADLINEQTGKTFTRTTISNYETGHSSPSLDLLPLIAKIFDVSIDELFGFQTTNEDATAVTPTINPNASVEYPDYPKQGSSKVYEDAVIYGYRQDELIIKIRNQIVEMTAAMIDDSQPDLRPYLQEATDILSDLTSKYHDQTHKLVDAYQRSNRLAEMLKAPYKL